ncbi:MAG: XdhC family protein [Oculatellaceae cyanobacterium Prado106]|nr:XdhC family protein [Oculatellaceae cyanobacterium Prado106]
MLNFYRQLDRRLQQEAVVVATVMGVKGSVPREVGAKMLIAANQNTEGTIGGGAGEAKVIRQAMIVLQTGKKQQVEIDLTGNLQRQTEGICGGTMQVWLERWQGETAIALTRQILHHLESGQTVTLVTPFAPEQSPFLLEENSPEHSVLHSQSHSQSHPNTAFTETLTPPPTLLIVGAGHCGVELAKVADLIGFQVMVQDDRPEWANRDRYPQAARIFTEAIAPSLQALAAHAQLYVALVTRGYAYDLEALQALLQRPIPCCYIGMIGSQKRVRQVMQAIATPDMPTDLPMIHAPIGLDIGALTPAEIAVSIAAELILVRRGGTGTPLSKAYSPQKQGDVST